MAARLPKCLTETKDGLALAGVPLVPLAEELGTPLYVYDVDGMVDELRALRAGYGDRDHVVCFAVKANTAGRILERFAKEGAGADTVSGGEIQVARGAGIPADRIVFSGVAKADWELDLAIGEGILSIHAESVEELARIDARARALGKTARASLRVNPSVEVDTHANISTGHDEAKFGIPHAAVPRALSLLETLKNTKLVGLSAHVGSQLTQVAGYREAAGRLAELARSVLSRGFALELLDTGGGMGIDYGDGCEARPADFVRAAIEEIDRAGLSSLRLLSEPGRALVGAHGVLLADVLQTKRHERPGSVGWLLLSAGMNDLARTALYQARHRIVPLAPSDAPLATWRVAGPVCESTCDFGTYELPDPPPPAVALLDAGAYGWAMASQYNGRSMPREAFVEGGRVTHVSSFGSRDLWVRGRLGTTDRFRDKDEA